MEKECNAVFISLKQSVNIFQIHCESIYLRFWIFDRQFNT